MNTIKLTPAIRRRVYEVALAGVAVAVVYGLLDGNQAAAWLVLIAAVLGLARVNVNDAD